MAINDSFYTSCYVSGDNILYRGVHKGQRVIKKIKYKPSLFIPINKDSKYKTLYGENVDKITFDSILEAREFIDKYKEVDNFKICGNTKFNYCFLCDTFPDVIQYDINDILIANIDIETGSDNGFPEPEQAIEPVTAITVKMNGIFHIFGCGDFTPHLDNIKYYHCKDEVSLLRCFVEFWSNNYPDIITGYNVSAFDLPYLVNRITKLCGESFVKKLSPWGRFTERSVTLFGKQRQEFSIQGISTLDYLELYKKYAPNGYQESYKLNHIASVELNEKKVSYEEYGNLRNLYKENYQLFMEYNCVSLDSHIWCNDRIEYIKDIRDNEKLLDSEVINKFPISMKEEYEITTTLGQKIYTSKDHIIPVIIGNPKDQFNKKDLDVSSISDILYKEKQDSYIFFKKHTNNNKNLTYKKLLILYWKDFVKYNHFDFCIHDKKIKEILNSKGIKIPYYFKSNFNLWRYSNIGKYLSDDDVIKFFERTDNIYFVFSKWRFLFNINIEISKDDLYILGLIYTDGTSIWRNDISEKSKDRSNRIFSRYNITNTNLGIMEYVQKYSNKKIIKYSPKTYKVVKPDGTIAHGVAKDRFTILLKSGSGIGILFPLIYNNKNKKFPNIKILSSLSFDQFTSMLSGIIDGDGSIYLNLKRSETSVQIVDWNGGLRVWQELISWNGGLSTIKDSSKKLFILSFIDNKKILNNLSLKHDKKIEKLIKLIQFRPDRELNSCRKHAKVRNIGDYFLIKIKSIINTNKKVKMIDITTNTNYFNVSGIKVHNCQDVNLVDKLEDKLRLIELVLAISYHAKVNYEDVFGQISAWDNIIFNEVKKNNIVVPPKEEHIKESYVGAYVKDPIPGFHKWVVSLDLNSLYPNIMRTCNISPETLSNNFKSFSVENLLDKEVELDNLKNDGLVIAGNGQCFDSSFEGIFPRMMRVMYNERSEYKNKMLDAEKELQIVKEEIERRKNK